ncbi:MAG TPA: hypothetical protein QF353_04800 [Gammaproteobacteria bacterium]|nr:hypothetical protein [Gammaproteobacteria bacterium]
MSYTNEEIIKKGKKQDHHKIDDQYKKLIKFKSTVLPIVNALVGTENTEHFLSYNFSKLSGNKPLTKAEIQKVFAENPWKSLSYLKRKMVDEKTYGQLMGTIQTAFTDSAEFMNPENITLSNFNKHFTDDDNKQKEIEDKYYTGDEIKPYKKHQDQAQKSGYISITKSDGHSLDIKNGSANIRLDCMVKQAFISTLLSNPKKYEELVKAYNTQNKQSLSLNQFYTTVLEKEGGIFKKHLDQTKKLNPQLLMDFKEKIKNLDIEIEKEKTKPMIPPEKTKSRKATSRKRTRSTMKFDFTEARKDLKKVSTSQDVQKDAPKEVSTNQEFQSDAPKKKLSSMLRSLLKLLWEKLASIGHKPNQTSGPTKLADSATLNKVEIKSVVEDISEELKKIEKNNLPQDIKKIIMTLREKLTTCKETKVATILEQQIIILEKKIPIQQNVEEIDNIFTKLERALKTLPDPIDRNFIEGKLDTLHQLREQEILLVTATPDIQKKIQDKISTPLNVSLNQEIDRAKNSLKGLEKALKPGDTSTLMTGLQKEIQQHHNQLKADASNLVEKIISHAKGISFTPSDKSIKAIEKILSVNLVDQATHDLSLDIEKSTATLIKNLPLEYKSRLNVSAIKNPVEKFKIRQALIQLPEAMKKARQYSIGWIGRVLQSSKKKEGKYLNNKNIDEILKVMPKGDVKDAVKAILNPNTPQDKTKSAYQALKNNLDTNTYNKFVEASPNKSQKKVGKKSLETMVKRRIKGSQRKPPIDPKRQNTSGRTLSH